MTYINTAIRFGILAVSATLLLACGNSGDVTADTAEKQAEVRLETTRVDTAAIANMEPMELMDAATVQSNQLADTLAAVTDQASAEVAIAEMRALGPQLKAVSQRLESLDQSDFKLSVKSMKKIQTFAEAQSRIFNEMGRIATEHPELRETIMNGFEDLEITVQ